MQRSTRHSRVRIYLAGPEVFLPNAREVGAEKRRVAAEAGFEGVFPLDNALDLAGLDKAEQARRISLANEEPDALLRRTGRQPHPVPRRVDGRRHRLRGRLHARARAARSPATPTRATTTATDRTLSGRGPAHHFDADRPHVEIEDFGLAENLMIEIAIAESGCTVVRSHVTAGTEMTDLSGFRQSLAELATVLTAP